MIPDVVLVPQRVLLLAFVCVCMLSGCSHPLSPRIELVHRIPHHTVDVANQKVTYLDEGQGPPIILLHGFGGAIWNWEYQHGVFSRTHRVLIPDLHGSGFSDQPQGRYSPMHLVEFFLQFMDRLQISQAVLIGNSMGAGLAMAMAIDHPDRVKSLVLISGFPPNIHDSVASPKYRQFVHHRPPLWLAKFGNWISGRSTTKHLLKEIIFRHELITPTVIERSYRNRQRDGLLEPLYALLDQIDQWEPLYGKRIPQIQQPTLILWGDHDQVFPLSVGKHLAQLVPQASWQVILDAGHLPQWEQPDQVNPAILRFLSAHQGSA